MESKIPAPSKINQLEYQVRFDKQGRVLGDSLHSSLGELLGISLGDREDIDIFQYLDRIVVLDVELPGRVARRVRKLIAEHNEFSLSGDFRRGSQLHHLHISGRVIQNSDGEQDFTLLFLDDTEHTQLRRLYEYMFRLANHEIKSPLACILGALEYAEEHAAAGNLEGVKTSLEMIRNNAHATEDMLNRYLNLSRIESGILTIVPSDIRIFEDVINPLAGEFQPRLQRKGMRLTFNCPNLAEEPTITADPEKVEIVLRNLISNALKYGHPNTSITVVLRSAQDGFEITVENEGPNIPQSHLDKLFEKFVRLDSTQGTKGSGLGLYNSRKVVELWGGRIWVESDSAKTRFTFTLPVE
ncbi:MAG: HAMP domain-containing histidine kinase [Candidatus Hydrogenedentes bacterium]|nr:HAMP domain-containing histidine kinase [Candidatus Hydrogenedentota bacterium]